MQNFSKSSHIIIIYIFLHRRRYIISFGRCGGLHACMCSCRWSVSGLSFLGKASIKVCCNLQSILVNQLLLASLSSQNTFHFSPACRDSSRVKSSAVTWGRQDRTSVYVDVSLSLPLSLSLSSLFLSLYLSINLSLYGLGSYKSSQFAAGPAPFASFEDLR